MDKSKHLGLHIDAQLHEKLKYVSAYEGRSMTGQVLWLIRRCVAEFEQEHGSIPDEPEKE